jgi:hypothetical protein
MYQGLKLTIALPHVEEPNFPMATAVGDGTIARVPRTANGVMVWPVLIVSNTVAGETWLDGPEFPAAAGPVGSLDDTRPAEPICEEGLPH